ncbi:MAG: response regulator [Candidatus Moranbacteria bacterium]|nr:response regulator [Candidatus Moranbacteria bacterium]
MKILFVEDEPAVLDVLSRMLEIFGKHEVIGRTSSTEALNLFSRNPELFDVVITDQTMPNMKGTELAQRILCVRPAMPIILCTGYHTDELKREASALGIQGFVAKPSTFFDILKVIDDIVK